MGTNYFIRTPPCEHCGAPATRLHIGKSSAGWNFGLRVYPNIDGEHADQLRPFGVASIIELDDWRKLFERFQIIDEYDDPVATEDMLATITQRRHPKGLASRLTAGPELMGPYPQRDGLSAGAGTYDLCNYEFS